jgi:N-acetylglucosamine kinase-like BadF-type ATPase
VPFFLGIDGGGTKTRCIIGNEKSVLATGSGSGCNIVRVGEACARDSLAAAIHEACVQAGVSPQQIARTCAGVAGAADDGVASLVQRVLIGIVGGAIEVIGDMEIALESAFGGGAGIVVIAGTGAIAYGRNERGESARAGGWGRLVADEGSGHWIGVRAIGAALREHDRGDKSKLLYELMEALEVRSVHDLAVKANSDPVPEFARLFPVVVRAEESGDANAIEVLERAGVELAATAEIVSGRLFLESEHVSVAIHGGVFAGSVLVKNAFRAELNRLCPKAKCVDTEVDPALGALEIARREFGLWHKG